MTEFCTAERDGHLLIVTINRPERMNALHPPANFELEGIFNDFAADPDLWVAIITGAGDRAFSAGNDLRWQAEGNKLEVPATGFAGLTARFDLAKPVIAAVNGVAMGGGFEIALACDLIIASDNAKFALPEPKVGLAALAGGLHRLPRQIGVKQAMGMILTGRQVPAADIERPSAFPQSTVTSGRRVPRSVSTDWSLVIGRHGLPRSALNRVASALTVTQSCRRLAPVIALTCNTGTPSTSS